MADDQDDTREQESGARRERIAFSPSPMTLRYLKQLVALGVYGTSPTAAASRLIDEGIRIALKDGLIEKEREA